MRKSPVFGVEKNEVLFYRASWGRRAGGQWSCCSKACVLLLVLIAFSIPRTTGAQPATTPSSEAAAKAFDDAKQLFEQRRYIKAAAAFSKAYQLRPHFLVQCSIARCYENLGKLVTAAKHYKRCLDEGADKTPMAERVRASLQDVENQLTWVTVRTPEKKAGKVYVDGKLVGPAPRHLALNPGNHLVEVRRPGARPAKTMIKTMGGEERTVTLSPVDLPKPPRAPRISKRPPQKRGIPTMWFWISAGVTVALGATTAVLGAQTLSLKKKYDDSPTKDELDTFTNRRLMTNIFAGATAAAAGGSMLLFFFTDFSSSKEEAGKKMSTFGLGIQGTF